MNYDVAARLGSVFIAGEQREFPPFAPHLTSLLAGMVLYSGYLVPVSRGLPFKP